jgi:hypothetical protein
MRHILYVTHPIDTVTSVGVIVLVPEDGEGDTAVQQRKIDWQE